MAIEQLHSLKWFYYKNISIVNTFAVCLFANVHSNRNEWNVNICGKNVEVLNAKVKEIDW